jgi:hypothetical protein
LVCIYIYIYIYIINFMQIKIIIMSLMTAVTCPTDQLHKGCADSCSVTCRARAAGLKCTNKCFEGCVCGVGMAKNDKGICLPVSSCPCYFNGVEYEDGYQEFKTNGKQHDIWYVCKLYNANKTIGIRYTLSTLSDCVSLSHFHSTGLT